MNLSTTTTPSASVTRCGPEQQPVRGSTVWTRSTIRDADYVFDVDAAMAAEITRCKETLVAQGKGLTTVEPEDFRLPVFSRIAAEMVVRMTRGVGFVLLRGLPFSGWTDEQASMLYWGIGTYLGSPLPQNRLGERVYLVQDTGAKPNQVRGSKTNSELIYHTDSASAFAGSRPDLLGLLCLRPAVTGGTSQMVSGHTAYNQLLAQNPSLVETLYGQFHFDRTFDKTEDESPTTVGSIFEGAGHDLRIRYNRYWIELGHHNAGIPLTKQQRQALDAYDAALCDPANVLEFDLNAGDVFFANNHVTLHNRRAFVDAQEISERRCLVRLWLTGRAA